ncbi:MAG TPA: Hsp20/alpha crystallin family protein [Candidatus Brocadiia bacterium]|nr:Hsp20/alpha crystallin family protein [Planctomycetota bacterium]MBI4007718.1 Hsp20/alpha crystallin family protein [Planctomycetota bacterium]MDO8092068.1 Hsp20/alpha crystallin family protein [Candidatus Brocadiales bacterium]
MTLFSILQPYKTHAKGDKVEGVFVEGTFLLKKPTVSFSHELWIPPTDVYETPEEFVVKMAISGIKPNDISVEFSAGILTISGKRFDNSNHKKTHFYQVEIRYGYFERKIVLPKTIDENNISATYKDGFLLVTIPKSQAPTKKSLSVKITL